MKNIIGLLLHSLLIFMLAMTLTACGGTGGGRKDPVQRASASSLASTSQVSVSLSSISLSSISAAAASDINPGTGSSSIWPYSSAVTSSVVVSSSARESSAASQSSVVVSSNASAGDSPVSSISAALSSSLSSASSQSSAAVLQRLSVSLENDNLTLGDTTMATATGYYSDGSSELVADVQWGSSDESIAVIDEQGKITAKRAGQASITAKKPEITSDSPVVVVKNIEAVLREIYLKIEGTMPMMKGDIRKFEVIAEYTNGVSQALPLQDVSVTSSNQSVLSIGSGTLTALMPGVSTILLAYQNNSKSESVTVVSESISFHFLKGSWNSTIQAHWWPATGDEGNSRSQFPGEAMKDSDGDGWYDITIPNLKETHVLFNDGGAASAGFHQTADQYARAGGWFVADEFPNREGKYYGTWYEAKPILSEQDICDVTYFGAKGDGQVEDTKAIQKAIDSCAGKNGIVRLRNGKFLTGMLELKSNMTLRIEPSAVLLGSRDPLDYPTLPKLSDNGQYRNCRKALIHSAKASNIRIDGGGTIDANGGNGSQWVTDNKNNPYYEEFNRPIAIFLEQTDGITLQNITVKNSAMWTIVPFESKNIIIRGVRVESLQGRTRDGIDPVDSHHVLIEAVDLATEDDAICFKSGSHIGVNDALVRYSSIRRVIQANGIKFGTASKGPIKDITFENISIENVKGSAMAVESVEGSAISNIVFRNIEVKNTGTPFYIVLGDRGATSAATARVGSIEKIQFENITADNMTQTWGSFISGIRVGEKTYYLRDLLFKNVDLTFKGGSTNFGPQPEYNSSFKREYPDAGDARTDDGYLKKKDMPGYLFFRHIHNLSLINVQVKVAPRDSRPLIVKEDVH